LNLFGVTFFVVEILSAGREGWLPRRVESNLAAPEAAQAGERGDRSVSFRRLGAIGLLVGLALVVVPPVWSLFPTGIVYERLCNERAGEHLYKTVSAKSYVLIGEGAGGDAFHLHHALEDVTEHRAEFVEVVKDRANNHQANAFGMLLRNHNPPGDVFRVALGASGSRDCISRPTPMYGTKFTLEVGQCLRFTPIAAPTSRYRVEVINNEQARWYTPHIRTYGVRVVDGEEGSVLGEHVRFVRGGMLAFFVVGDKNLSCPSPYRFQPTQIHRKALLGGQ